MILLMETLGDNGDFFHYRPTGWYSVYTTHLPYCTQHHDYYVYYRLLVHRVPYYGVCVSSALHPAPSWPVTSKPCRRLRDTRPTIPVAPV